MKLRYSLSLFYAQTRAWLQRVVYKQKAFNRSLFGTSKTFFYTIIRTTSHIVSFIFTYWKQMVLALGSAIALALVSLVIYRYQVSYSTKLYHQIFYIKPFWAKLTSKPTPEFPRIHPLLVESYQVVEGDTYWDIAKKTGVYLDTLISYNNPKDIFKVRPNETIHIPLQDGILYKRTLEETPEKIGNHYDIDSEKIIYFNPDWKNETNLFIPGAYFSYVERLKKLGAEFANPLLSFRLTSSFGYRIHPFTKKRSFHKGVDLGAAIGTAVYAASSGIVIVAREAHGYGNIVIIHHGNNKFTRYGHLLDFSVKPGQKVIRGQQIGKVGSTGISTGPHLHFEVWKQNKPINPIGVTDFFSKPKQ